METRGSGYKSTHHHRGSHRRPHHTEEARMNRHDFEDGGMAGFVDSLEGTNMGSRHHATKVRSEDINNGEAHHADSFVEHKETRHAKHLRDDHRHKEHRHGEHRHEKHGHEEHGHKEHRHGEKRHLEHLHGKHGPREEEFNKRLYESAFLRFSEKSGSSYPCKQSEIDFHHRGEFLPNKGPFVTATQATEEVMRWNDEKRAPPRKELDIIFALANAIHDAEKNLRFGPDLIIKATADLDRVFFGGRLRGHIVVKWVIRTGSSGKTYGTCRQSEHGQCNIELGAQTILLKKWRGAGNNPAAQMFGTLLHEMCHAYESVRCPSVRHNRVDGHDEHFATKLRVVHDRAIRILGVGSIKGWEPWRDLWISSKEGEKGGKVGNSGGLGGVKKYDGGEKILVGTRSGGQRWGTRKEDVCIVM